MLQPMGLQRVRHDLVTEQKQQEMRGCAILANMLGSPEHISCLRNVECLHHLLPGLPVKDARIGQETCKANRS